MLTRPAIHQLALLLWLWPLHVAAMERYDFSAHYDVLSHAGARIGTYTSVVNGPQAGVYTLRGEIDLNSRALKLMRKTWSSSDIVHYDADGVSQYEIIEIDHGRRTRISGRRSEDLTRLHLLETPQTGKVRVNEILRSAYDYILYDFRFPLACAQQAGLLPREMRILAPRSGKIERVRSEPAPVDGTHASAYGQAGCRLIARNQADEIIKDSWFLQDGILLFEKTADYQLQLTRIEYGPRE